MIFIFLLSGSLTFLWSQENDSLFPDPLYEEVAQASTDQLLFTSKDILEITIQVGDLKKLIRDNGDNPAWHEGVLMYENIGGPKVILNVKLKTRGHFRKDPAHCNFPPLCVNFKESEVGGTIFEGQNKLKLVTHCKNKSLKYDQYLLKEYLAYRMYNVLTEKSYRVRLAEITYIDENDHFKTITRHGFFIEETKDMAKRNGFIHIRDNKISQRSLDFFYQDLLTIFQYMIGNTDWSVPARHNIKLIQEKPYLRPVPVPYDFDWSGFVNPVYAKPSEKLGIQTVEERLFRGYSKDIEDYNQIFDLFLQKKQEIFGLLDECPLDEKNYEIAENYIHDFYSIISNEKRAMTEFVVKARCPKIDSWGK